MALLQRASIKQKLMRIIILTSSVALLLGCLAFVAYDVFQFRRSMVRDLETLAQIVAENVSPSLSFIDTNDAQGILKALRAKPNITTAQVFTANGSLFARYPAQAPVGGLPPALERIGQPRFRGAHLEWYSPITSGGETIGTLYLQSDLRELTARLNRYPGIIGGVMLLSMAAALLLSARLQKVISQPVSHLAATARLISEERNYSVRAVKETHDEIGNLIDAFNDMLGQIQQRDAALQQARDELERRVEERTRELQEEIQERKRAEEATQISEVKFRSLVESANDAIILANGDGNIILWNTGAEAIFGFAPEEVLGRPLTLIMPAQFREGHSPGLNRYRATGISRVIGKTVELAGLRKDGTEFPLELSLSSWHIGEVIYFSGIVRDITERKQTYERLKMLAAKLEQSNHELQAFAYVASHDLQEPLRKVQAFGDRLKASCGGAFNEEGRDFLDRMLNAARRMQNLINDLLLFSRVSTQASPFQPLSLCQVVREVLSDLEVRLQQTGGRVELGELPTLEADPTQMRQLFQNLISNALKFHRTGVPPEVKIRSEMISAPNGPALERPSADGKCRILIEDNGIGFDEKYRDRIFGVFQRLHGRQTYEGTGIGLAICRKIAERHSGTVTAQSTPGQGATFVVTLPLKQKKEPHES